MRMFRGLVLLLFSLSSFAISQEIDCEITTKQDGLPAQAIENLNDFIPQVKEYINSYRWTNVDLGTDKIKCRMDLVFRGSPRDNHYTVQAFIGSERPIFQSNGQSTAILRLLDDKWEFDYVRGTPLTHNDMRFDPLLSFLDFYAYVILGFDFESYKAGDGTPYFQKALDILNRAQSSGNAGPGWDYTSDNVYSRFQLINEILDSKFHDVRGAFYRYHYRGLDLLAKDETRARKNIMTALEKIGRVQEKINQRSLLIRLFFETKYQEIGNIFVKDPDLTVFSRITKIDPSHKQDYEERQRAGR